MIKTTDQIHDQAPPHDIEAETWVVGSVLLKSDCLDDLGFLRPDDFYADDLRKIFAAMIDMHHAGQPIDAGLLCKRLGGEDWAAKIYEICTAVPVAAHVKHYAPIVANMAQRRRLREIGLTIAEGVQRDDSEPDGVLEKAETDLAGIRASGDRGEAVSLFKASEKAVSRIDEICKRGCGYGLPSGLESFDADMGGLFPGELTILAARPGVGKTALGLQVGYHNAARNRLVYFVSLEMNADELATRLACGQSGVSNRIIRNGQLTSENKAALVQAFNEQSAATLEICDSAAMTVAGIRREIRKRKKRGLALAVVDYLQLVQPDDRRLPREQQVARMIRTLKETAREYQIPILVLCQLNRQIEATDVPGLGHLRESGSIEQDADVVWFLNKHKPTNGEWHNAVLTVAKNRNGETGSRRLDWDGARTRFTDQQPDDF